MNLDSQPEPLLDSALGDATAPKVRQKPDHVLAELAASERRNQAAATIGEIIIVDMSMTYPELLETTARPLAVQMSRNVSQ